jgi:serine/threonine protein kinase
MNAEEILQAAVEKKTPAERAAYLDGACAGNAALRAQIEALLKAHDDAGRFLEEPLFAGGPTVDAPANLDRPGTIIGPYKLLQQLGEGGMGTVFMAEQTQPVQRKVALKVIKPGMDSRHVLARFEAERQALALMDHPHIAKVLDAGMTGSGRPYFVMELVKGVPITQYCDREHLTPKERLELFIPVCQAVQHAHQKGIIHRDLKPSNVLIALYDGKPVPKVIDFGVAKATGHKLTDKTMFTEVGQVVGTLEYMAPEQAELNNLDIDTRADIYSLGALLYQLMTGSPPFTRQQLQNAAYAEMLRIIREVEPPKPSTKLSSSQELPALAVQRKLEPKRLTRLLKGDLDWIVMKCLEKERSRRYETANGLAIDIQRFLAHEPVLAGPPGAAYRVRKFVRRNRAGVVSVAAFVALLLVGIAACAWQAIRATNAESEARANEQKALEAAAAESRAKEEAQSAAASETKAKNAAQAAATAEAEQRSAAEAERQIAQAVRDFLQDDLLLQADAGEQVDRLRMLGGAGFEVKENPTVKELLERAAAGLTPQRIEQRFPNAPLVQAEILYTVGRAYHAIGDFAKAITHLQRAADLRRSQLGPDHPDTLRVLHDLGFSFFRSGNTVDAITVHEKSRDARLAKLGRDHPDTLASQISLADAYRVAGRTADAIALLEGIRELCIARLGQGHITCLTMLNDLALSYAADGRTNDAIELMENVRDAGITKPGPNHPHTLMAIANLGWLYGIAGRHTDAVAVLEKNGKASVAILGPVHFITLYTLRELAKSYAAIGRTEEAIAILTKTRTALIDKCGPDHPETLRTLISLGVAYWSLHKLEKSVPLFEDLLQRHTRTFGLEHPDTVQCAVNLAVNYRGAERLADAANVIDEWLPRAQSRLGAAHSTTLFATTTAIRIQLALGQFDRARKLATESIAVLEKEVPADDARLTKAVTELAGTLLQGRRFVDSITLCERFADSQRAKLGAGHPLTLTALHSLGFAYASAGKRSEAIAVYEKVRDGRVAKLGLDHADTLTTMNNLGVGYLSAGRTADAIALLEKVREARVIKPGPGHPETVISTSNLITALEQANRFDRASELGTELLAVQRKQLAADDPRLAGTLALLGLNLLKAGKPAAAEPIVRECVDIRMKKEADSWKLFSAKSLLGGSLLGQKKYTDAEPLLLEGYEGMKAREKAIPPAGKARLPEAAERLVQLNESTNRKSDADKWARVLAEYRRPDGKLLEPIQDVGKELKLSGKLDAETPALIYQVRLKAGVTYVIDMVSPDEKALDPYLYLRDEKDNPLAEDDDSGDGLNAGITYRPTADGVYRIRATAFNNAARGDFTLTVRARD